MKRIEEEYAIADMTVNVIYRYSIDRRRYVYAWKRKQSTYNNVEDEGDI